MFSSNATPASEFPYARKIGATINLDDFTHIEFLEKCAGLPETISCRFNPGGLFQLSNGIMDNPAMRNTALPPNSSLKASYPESEGASSTSGFMPFWRPIQ